MLRPPPRSTLTDPLFPSTPLFRSALCQRRESRRSGGDCRPRRRLVDPFVDMVRELGEIVDELLHQRLGRAVIDRLVGPGPARVEQRRIHPRNRDRSEEHTSELQSLMRISYAVFCLKKKKKTKTSEITESTTPQK